MSISCHQTRHLFAVAAAILMLATVPARPEEPQADVAELPPDEAQLFREADDAIRRGDHEWALEHLQKFIQSHPASAAAPRAHLERGIILEHQERYELSAAAYEQAVRMAGEASRSVEARLNLSGVYRRLGRFGDIPGILEPIEWIDLDPEQRMTLYRRRAAAYEALGQEDEARLDRLRLWQVLVPGTERTALELLLIDDIRRIEDEKAAEEKLRAPNLPPFYESALLERLLELRIQSKNLAGSLDVIDRYLLRFPKDKRARLMETRRRDLMQASEVDTRAVGVLLPVSARGALGYFAERARKAIDAAVARTSRKTGADTIRIIVRDTGGRAEQAVAALNDLVSTEKVVAVVGPVGGSEVRAVAQRAAELGIPVFALSPADDLPGAGSFVFRMIPTANEQVSAIVAHARGSLGLKNFAALYPDTPLGQALFSHYVDEVERFGGRLTGAEKYDTRAADFKAPLYRLAGLQWADARRYEAQRNKSLKGWTPYSPRKMDEIERHWLKVSGREDMKLKPRPELPPVVDYDALFIAGMAQRVGLILPQITFRDVRGAQLYGFSEWNDPELFLRAGGQADGAIIVDGFHPALEHPDAAAFIRAFTPLDPPVKPSSGAGGTPAGPPSAASPAPDDRPPGMFEARAYDAIGLIVDASSQLGIPSRTGLALRLLSPGGYSALGGRIRFYPDGRADLPLVLLEARGREFVLLAR
ncbi:MAG: penicillin-binding protein activator [Deltaproteobacteria bacterium]|nr:penicillin-binding protein activator [Deltaproteobacteria bacterium]